MNGHTETTRKALLPPPFPSLRYLTLSRLQMERLPPLKRLTEMQLRPCKYLRSLQIVLKKVNLIQISRLHFSRWRPPSRAHEIGIQLWDKKIWK